jgi:hypothetical protein
MKLRPNDIVAAVSVACLLATAISFILAGQILLSLYTFGAGAIIVIAVNRYENRIYRKGGTLSWLDWMQVRDMMATAHNREAINFILAKAYNMDEKQVMALSPEDLDVLLQKLKTKGGPR